MIVLFSYAGDRNTNRLIEWLQYFNCDYKRVDLFEEDYRNINIVSENGKIHVNFSLKCGKILNFSEVSYFYVRGRND